MSAKLLVRFLLFDFTTQISGKHAIVKLDSNTNSVHHVGLLIRIVTGIALEVIRTIVSSDL